MTLYENKMTRLLPSPQIYIKKTHYVASYLLCSLCVPYCFVCSGQTYWFPTWRIVGLQFSADLIFAELSDALMIATALLRVQRVQCDWRRIYGSFKAIG